MSSRLTFCPDLVALSFKAKASVTFGPYWHTKAEACSSPRLPKSPFPGHIPTIVPTAKLASMIDEPSKGSKATENPSPVQPQSISTGFSSEAAT